MRPSLQLLRRAEEPFGPPPQPPPPPPPLLLPTPLLLEVNCSLLHAMIQCNDTIEDRKLSLYTQKKAVMTSNSNIEVNLEGPSTVVYGTVLYFTQGRAFRGRKFRIFLEKAIIALKPHSRHFLTEDFYIFIFSTFIVKNIFQF